MLQHVIHFLFVIQAEYILYKSTSYIKFLNKILYLKVEKTNHCVASIYKLVTPM